MNICLGAKVISQDGTDVGRIRSLIFTSALRQVTHLVVHKGILLPHDTLVPLSLVQGNRGDGLILHIAGEDAGQLPRYHHGMFRTGPAGSQEVATAPEGERFGVEEPPERADSLKQAIHFEPDSVEITKDTAVEALDGTIGKLSCFRVDQNTYRLTYVVVEKGALANKELAVPTEWVNRVGGDRITLSVPMQQVIAGPPPPAGPYIPVEPSEEEMRE